MFPFNRLLDRDVQRVHDLPRVNDILHQPFKHASVLDVHDRFVPVEQHLVDLLLDVEPTDGDRGLADLRLQFRFEFRSFLFLSIGQFLLVDQRFLFLVLLLLVILRRLHLDLVKHDFRDAQLSQRFFQHPHVVILQQVLGVDAPVYLGLDETDENVVEDHRLLYSPLEAHVSLPFIFGDASSVVANVPEVGLEIKIGT